MAENNNVPYKEQEDGSILAKVGLDENEQFEEETKEEVKADAEEGDGEDEQHQDGR